MPKSPGLTLSHRPWMTTRGARAILKAITKAGGEARFVGGAVRDALLESEVGLPTLKLREAGDVDLAVNLPPQKVMKALKAAGIKVVPTGLAHGTVTAVADGKGYEITTLRRDVETYGRRAKVAFTDDWSADASRRDFTFNALYADSKGKIYDYFDGLEDLKAGQVRFIGSASGRIKEDALRILRFFRFHAWYGRGTPDRDALLACKKLASLMRNLSAERVWKELNRLLLAPDPAPAVRLMIKTGVLRQVLPEAKNVKRLEKLVKLEKECNHPPLGEGRNRVAISGRGIKKTDPSPAKAKDLLRKSKLLLPLPKGRGAISLRRLAALIGDDNKAAAEIARRLRFSNRDKARLVRLAGMPGKLRGRKSVRALRRLMYENGVEAVRDGLLLLTATGGKINLKAALSVINAWESPVFPIQGQDVLKLGVRPGPAVGKILIAVKEWWIARDFKPTRAACIEQAKRILKRGK